MSPLAVVFLRLVSVFFALLAVLSAVGWGLTASIPHALGWLAASVLAFVLSTVPVGPVA